MVRLIDTIDSSTAQTGDKFHATLDAPIAIDGDVVVPAHYDVQGHVVNAQASGKFAGQALLTLQLDRIKVGDKNYDIQTDQFSQKTNSRGKNTAEKVGGGAIAGAILGGIFGGGKGAAIGSAAGAGAGGGVQAASKKPDIKLSSEKVLNFTLQAPVTLVPTTKPAREGQSSILRIRSKVFADLLQFNRAAATLRNFFVLTCIADFRIHAKFGLQSRCCRSLFSCPPLVARAHEKPLQLDL